MTTDIDTKLQPEAYKLREHLQRLPERRSRLRQLFADHYLPLSISFASSAGALQSGSPAVITTILTANFAILGSILYLSRGEQSREIACGRIEDKITRLSEEAYRAENAYAVGLCYSQYGNGGLFFDVERSSKALQDINKILYERLDQQDNLVTKAVHLYNSIQFEDSGLFALGECAHKTKRSWLKGPQGFERRFVEMSAIPDFIKALETGRGHCLDYAPPLSQDQRQGLEDFLHEADAQGYAFS